MNLAPPSLDPGALERGMLVAAVVAVPAALVGTAVVGDEADPSGWVLLFTLVVLGGLVAGAAVAGARQRAGAPITHGMVAAVGVYVVVQVISLVRQVVRGDDIAWSQVFSSLMLSLMAGLVGGLLGSWLAGRRRPRSPRASESLPPPATEGP